MACAQARFVGPVGPRPPSPAEICQRYLWRKARVATQPLCAERRLKCVSNMRRLAVSAACLVLVSSCGTGHQAADIAVGPTPVAAAQTLCNAFATSPVATASLTTLGAVRTSNFGGPSPGLTPLRDLFRGHLASERAAWCWSAAPVRDASGPSWSLRVAIPGAQSQVLFVIGGGPAPTGAPMVA